MLSINELYYYMLIRMSDQILELVTCYSSNTLPICFKIFLVGARCWEGIKQGPSISWATKLSSSAVVHHNNGTYQRAALLWERIYCLAASETVSLPQRVIWPRSCKYYGQLPWPSKIDINFLFYYFYLFLFYLSCTLCKGYNRTLL